MQRLIFYSVASLREGISGCLYAISARQWLGDLDFRLYPFPSLRKLIRVIVQDQFKRPKRYLLILQ